MRIIILQNKSISPWRKPNQTLLSQLHFKCFLSEIATSTDIQMTNQRVNDRSRFDIDHLHTTVQDIRIQQVNTRSIIHTSFFLLPFPSKSWFNHNLTPRGYTFKRYTHFFQSHCIVNMNGRGTRCYSMMKRPIMTHVIIWLPSGVNKQDKTEQCA